MFGSSSANYTPTRCVNPCPPVFIRVGISIQKPVDSHLDKIRPAVLKKLSCLIFNVHDLIVKLTEDKGQKKNDCFRPDVFCFHCITVFEATRCFYHFCPCQELRPSLTEEDIRRSSRKRVLDELRRGYRQEKVFNVIKMWECEWWRLHNTTTNVNLHIRESLPYRRSRTEHQLLEGTKEGNLFGYLQCDIEVPEKLRAFFAKFPPLFKNTLVSKNDIGDLMKTNAEEEGIMSQPGRMLISSLTLRNLTLITPLLLFYVQLGLVVTKIHRFVEYTPENYFNSFVQAAVDEGKVTNTQTQVLSQKQRSF